MPRIACECQYAAIASVSAQAHKARDEQAFALDDPDNAAFAWSRWKRMMRIMSLVTLVAVIAVLIYLWAVVPEVSIHFYIAAGLGVGASMLLMSALMGLVFMSSGTGHDESVVDPLEDTWRR